jgi:Glycosyl hydrolases family 38 N-terminal domain
MCTWSRTLTMTSGARSARSALLPLRSPHLRISSRSWLKTLSEYATGSNNSIQSANTDLTIDTVLQNLLDNSDRTFSYVEQAFFNHWLGTADANQIAGMHKMVDEKQLVFLNGAWAMQDEAAPFYTDMIDNVGLGHRRIVEEFGLDALPTGASLSSLALDSLPSPSHAFFSRRG